MKYVDFCLVCNSKKLIAYFGITAPFIAERVWHSKPLRTKLLRCKNCGFEFYNIRLDEAEVALLYKGYRNDEYQKTRNKHEIIYTKEYNDRVGKDPIELENRKSNLSDIVRAHVDVRMVNTVLDFGGDSGQFIIDDFANAEKYVYEVSGVKPIPGVKMIDDLSTIDKKTFDFIMCCGVLEHVSYPLEVLNQIRKLAHRDTFLYFEVPIDSPFIFRVMSIKTTVKKILLSNASLYNIYYGISKYVRLPSAFYMHEHLNNFSIESMSNMLISNGFDVKYIASKEIDLGWNTINLLSCLAKLH